MFPDSQIAQQWSCGPTKLSYLITFGIAPYFKELLFAELTEAPCFVLSFDESFNQELQKEQMDFVVRYFGQGLVKTRYLTSAFSRTYSSRRPERKVLKEQLGTWTSRNLLRYQWMDPM